MKPPMIERLLPHRARLGEDSVPAGASRPFPSPCRFLRDVRGGATAIVAAAVTVMTIGGTALIGDHLWLVDQRDTLKSAAEAASVAATLEIDRQLTSDSSVSDADLKAALKPVAKRYVLLNLDHLAPDRLKQAKDTLKVTLNLNRTQRTVDVTASADLGGTLFSGNLPLLGGYKGPEATVARAGVEAEHPPVEVVLALDISSSMKSDIRGNSVSSARRNKSRIAIVKRAAKRLIAILDPDGANRVAIGIVPWHETVRLDTAAARKWDRKRWARYPGKRTYPAPFKCRSGHSCTVNPVVDTLPAQPPQEWKGCVHEDRIRAGVAFLPASTAAALFEPPSTSPFAQSYFRPADGLSYRCRDASEVPSSTSHSCYQDKPDDWAQVNCSVKTLTPLSTDRTAIEQTLRLMQPSDGSTYSALGVLWAQRMLEPAWKRVWRGGGIHPVDPATPEHAKARKAIVLLTDGEDNFCGGNSTECEDSAIAISRTDACDAAKSRGTEIFVIAAMHPNQASRALGRSLRACSSAADNPDGKYVFVNNASQKKLEAAFVDIANQLRTVRRTY